MNFQQSRIIEGAAARGAILNLNARYDRAWSAGDLGAWSETFKHTGAVFSRDGSRFTRLQDGFEGGGGRLVTVDHEIDVDGVYASQRCVGLVVEAGGLASGVFEDALVYERGNWYFASRSFTSDATVPAR